MCNFSDFAEFCIFLFLGQFQSGIPQKAVDYFPSKSFLKWSNILFFIPRNKIRGGYKTFLTIASSNWQFFKKWKNYHLLILSFVPKDWHLKATNFSPDAVSHIACTSQKSYLHFGNWNIPFYKRGEV